MLDPIVTQQKIALVRVGPLPPQHVINDYETAKELFAKESFSAKMLLNHVRELYYNNLTTPPKGILLNSGKTWRDHRKFGMRIQRNLGFGKQSLENVIQMEIDELIETFAATADDVKIENDFSMPFINVVWHVVAGKRFRKENFVETQVVGNRLKSPF